VAPRDPTTLVLVPIEQSGKEQLILYSLEHCPCLSVNWANEYCVACMLLAHSRGLQEDRAVRLLVFSWGFRNMKACTAGFE
jgi:hypothetical protein